MEERPFTIIKNCQIPACIVNNPNFKRIEHILLRDASLEKETFENQQTLEGNFLINSGLGVLKIKDSSYENIYGKYSYKIKNKVETNNAYVQSIEFKIIITDMVVLNVIKYDGINLPKLLTFEILPNSQSFKPKFFKTKSDISPIVKVTEQTFLSYDNLTSITYYNKDGKNLQWSLSKYLEGTSISK